ncbi:uncharacterized protein LOC135833842 [Planococcus citri]|uniref:uncharacterized protein LOC135833842 n=1 Tax=Planococcus citri TaxID=170843 RepID=UPI0031F91334
MLLTVTLVNIIFGFALCSPEVNGYISKCSDNGFKCASCEELIHCVGIPTNSFKVSLINYCDNSKGQYCSMEKGSCVNDANACQIFGLKTLHCEDTGAFPDPYDCNSYHMCIKRDDAWISTKHNCPEDRAFDPLTATCRFKLTHRVCQEKPVEPCMRPLQHGPILENPNIYFVCVQNDVHDHRLEPRLYKCKPGHIYSEHVCIESASISSSEMKFVCEKPGNFADPRNCYRYFECDGDLKSAHKTCRPGTYFDPKEATCVKGTC